MQKERPEDRAIAVAQPRPAGKTMQEMAPINDSGVDQQSTQAAGFTLADLARIIAQRAAASPEESHTAKLLARGPAQAAKKLGEEAVEAAIAAVQGDRAALTAEAADVLYHLLVVLKACDVPLEAVMAELERRTARSGLAEKASRSE
jgi:phosphoribosyl-ATP pyrophosphohydrolase